MRYLILAAALLVLGHSARSQPSIRFEVGEPSLVASLKTDGTALYAPHAFRASSGQILLGYYTYSDGWEPDPFPAALIRSWDEGATWQTLGERGNLGYVFGERRDGTVLALDCMWRPDKNGVPYYAAQVFPPAGRFAKPAKLKVRLHGFDPKREPYFHLTRMVRAQNGTLVTVAYTVTEGTTHDMWYNEKGPIVPVHIVCLASKDEGLDWDLLSYVDAADLGRRPRFRDEVSEPFVEALGDGRLLCLYRTETDHLGPLLASWSADSGATWTRPISTGLIGVDPCLLQLQDGVLLLSTGRPDIRLYYSLDGGAHWRGETTLYHYLEGRSRNQGLPSGERLPFSHAYTSIVALSPDRILCFFDIHEHRMPWKGALPSGPAPLARRSNSIFCLPIRILRENPAEVIETIVAPASPDNRRNSEGDLIVRKDGSLFLAWADYYSSDASDFGPSRVSAAISRDGGRHWGPRFTLQDNFSRLNVGQPDLIRLRSGRVLFTCPVCNSLEDIYPMLRFSDDDCRTFSEPMPIPVDPSPSYTGFNNDRSVQLKSGRILLPCWFTKDYAVSHRITSRIYYSDDEGRTWRHGGVIDIKASAERGADEPGVVELRDGRLLMWLRTDLGSVYRCYSSDQGETWSSPEPMGLPDPNAPQSMKRIPSTGDLLLVWNKSRTGRYPLSMALSGDDGRTWRQIRNLDAEPGHTYAYTSIEFDRDRVLFTYYDAVANSPTALSENPHFETSNISLKFKSVPVSWLYR